MRLPSNNRLLDILADTVQDLDGYYDRTGCKDARFRELEKAYKVARAAVLKRMRNEKDQNMRSYR